jgi:hypothetical protein
MELALVLSLRIYHVVPDSVLHVVSRHRQQLHRFYRKAYAQRASGKGRTVTCTIAHSKSFEIRGLFLDLGIKFSGGQLIKFGPPKLLSPAQTVIHFASPRSIQPIFPPDQSVLAFREGFSPRPVAPKKKTSLPSGQDTLS